MHRFTDKYAEKLFHSENSRLVSVSRFKFSLQPVREYKTCNEIYFTRNPIFMTDFYDL